MSYNDDSKIKIVLDNGRELAVAFSDLEKGLDASGFAWDVPGFHTRGNPTHLAWAVGNEFGVLTIVSARSEEEALEIATDNDLAKGLQCDEDNADDETYRNGYGEPFDLTYAWITRVHFRAQCAETQIVLAYLAGKKNA